MSEMDRAGAQGNANRLPGVRSAPRVWVFGIIAWLLSMGAAQPARAQLISIGDAYSQASAIIEDLIQHQAGNDIATAIDSSLHPKGRYLKATTNRLRSQYWGNLQDALKRDLNDLLVDYAYYVVAYSDSSGEGFWKCLRTGEGESCDTDTKTTLVEARCKDATVSIACDAARALGAALIQSPGDMRSHSVELFADLALIGNVSARAPTKEDFGRFRERIHVWLRDPEGLRAQVNSLTTEFDVPDDQLRRREISCSDQLSPDIIFDRVTPLACMSQPGWREKWDEVTVATVEVKAVESTTHRWTIEQLHKESIRNVSDLIQSAAQRECQASEAADLKQAIATIRESLKRTEEKYTLARTESVKAGAKIQNLMTEISALENELQRLPTDATNRAEKDAQLKKLKNELEEAAPQVKTADSNTETAQAAHTKVVQENLAFLEKLKGYFLDHGVVCTDGQADFADKTLLVVSVGAASSTASTQQELRGDAAKIQNQRFDMGLSNANLSSGQATEFQKRVTQLACGQCGLSDHVAALRRLRGASDFLLSLDPNRRNGILNDIGSATEIARLLGATGSCMTSVEQLISLSRAAKRNDYRELAFFAFEALWPSKDNLDREPKLAVVEGAGEASTDASTPVEPSQAESDRELFLAFFKTFATFLLDAPGEEPNEVGAVAFREAAKDVLVRQNKRGVPAPGRAAWGWISISLRQSWNRNYSDGSRGLASVDALSLRYAPVKYGGLGFSILDLLEPFAEAALRDQDVEYDHDGLWAVNALHPRVFAWIAVPELSRFLTVDGAVAYRPVAPLKVDPNCDSVCDREYSFKGEALDHIEFSVSLSLLF